MPLAQLPDDSKVFTIFQGDAKVMSMALTNDDADGGGPVDLTNCTQINIYLPNADGTFTALQKSTGAVVVTSPPVLGKFTANISAATSALLNVGELQNIDVTFTIGTEIFTVQYERSLSVFQAP
jgi:hypothetical protein